MSHWLLKARSALLHDNASSLDAARKLAVVNGLGEHSRAQVCLLALHLTKHLFAHIKSVMLGDIAHDDLHLHSKDRSERIR